MHLNTINLEGRVCGMLTVGTPAEKPENSKTKNRGAYWNCVCSCGNTCVMLSTALLQNTTQSCGCLRKRKYQDNPLYKGVGDFSKSMYTHMVYGAKKRNLEVSVSIEYLWDLFLKQEGKCYYTGYPITLNTRNKPKTASIDRVDNRKGYIEGNVVWCRKDINIMKMDKPIEDFYEICRTIASKHPIINK
jgi:hypothetical protein